MVKPFTEIFLDNKGDHGCFKLSECRYDYKLNSFATTTNTGYSALLTILIRGCSVIMIISYRQVTVVFVVRGHITANFFHNSDY